MLVYIDIETYCPLDIKKVGLYRYAEECELLLVAWAVDDGPVFFGSQYDIPEDPDVIYVAHNAMFERVVLSHHGCVIFPERWFCTASLARSLAFPGSLEAVGKAVSAPMDRRKLAEGRKLVKMFCQPQKPTKAHPYTRYTAQTHPEAWARFREYCAQDVESCRWLFRALPHWNQRVRELLVYAKDQEINDNGWPVDMEATERLCALSANLKDRASRRVSETTHGRVEGVTSTERLRRYLETEVKVPVPNVNRRTLQTLLTHPGLSQDARAVIEARLAGGRAAVQKFTRIVHAQTGGRLRGSYVYCGAGRTMRWSGKLVQPQNLYRPTVDPGLAVEAVLADADLELLYPSIPEALASAVRGVFRAPPGQKFVVGDFSQIEARVVAWLADERTVLERFADPKVDPYVEAARDVGCHDRQLGKVLTLACGFGMGGNRFMETAASYGLTLSLEEAERFVRLWRKANARIVALWKNTEGTVLRVLATGKPYKCGKIVWGLEEVDGVGVFLTGKLPSGHRLCYYLPRYDNEQLSYMGFNAMTRLWEMQLTWGGKLVENAVQAVARHLLADTLLRVPEGLELVGTTHDELIGLSSRPEEHLQALLAEMERPPSWAEGLPVAASGYIAERYRK